MKGELVRFPFLEGISVLSLLKAGSETFGTNVIPGLDFELTW